MCLYRLIRAIISSVFTYLLAAKLKKNIKFPRNMCLFYLSYVCFTLYLVVSCINYSNLTTKTEFSNY